MLSQADMGSSPQSPPPAPGLQVPPRLRAATVRPPSGLLAGAPSPCLSPQDAWTDQKGQIHLDSQQDYQLLQAQRTPDGLSLLFKRPFSTCDPQDYRIEVGGAPLSGLGSIPGPVIQRESQGETPEAAAGDRMAGETRPASSL